MDSFTSLNSIHNSGTAQITVVAATLARAARAMLPSHAYLYEGELQTFEDEKRWISGWFRLGDHDLLFFPSETVQIHLGILFLKLFIRPRNLR